METSGPNQPLKCNSAGENYRPLKIARRTPGFALLLLLSPRIDNHLISPLLKFGRYQVQHSFFLEKILLFLFYK